MTEKLKDGVSVPSWVLSVLMPLAITAMTGIVTVRVTSAVTAVKVDAIQKQIDQLQEKKANQEILNEFKAQLNRIENKLDGHLADHKK